MAEKFGRWRDPGTGIAPFLPITPSIVDTSPVELAARYTLVTILLVPRLATLVLGILGVVIVGDLVGLLISIVPPLAGVWRRWTYFIFFRSILFALGFWQIEEREATLRKGRPLDRGGHADGKVAPGDLVVSNHCSYVDVLWLAHRYAPTFVAPCSSDAVDTPPNFLPIHPLRYILVLLSSSAHPTLSSKGGSSLRSLLTTAKSSGHPICFFPEETTGNGRGLLRFGDGLSGVDVSDSKARVHVIGFRFDTDRPSATFPHGSFPSHLLSLLLSPSQTLVVFHLPPAELANLSVGTTDETTASLVAQALGRVVRLRQTGLGWRDKEEFVQFWRKKGEGRKERSDDGPKVVKGPLAGKRSARG
ncbi:hypothetical protein M427DRAFT_134104 [Gonapodya prolifera JEL478]|uniref:Phospholipid/glycerol acyltransferase domain-containing protein n=1 Tax=Gonapodya prolifera (strain JEL478) TaxID=1344416 RepID=A0A139AJ52_GONPJ|nr:hypothetical protein M427DRAFT_134104 [Gonapodya prolifera JEL478]|eukprot:KXS16493.1 hypothetical protein M427DRAFT_134104 [Gonapodya prolifera JEL478]